MSQEQISRAASAIDEAFTHHRDAVRMVDKGALPSVRIAHARLLRCLRSAQTALRSALDAAPGDDSHAGADSAGTDAASSGHAGTSSAGRAQRKARAAQLAKPSWVH